MANKTPDGNKAISELGFSAREERTGEWPRKGVVVEEQWVR